VLTLGPSKVHGRRDRRVPGNHALALA
jgi:hypothetical protein